MPYQPKDFGLQMPIHKGGRQAIADWIKGIAIILMVYGHLTHVGTQDFLQNDLVGIIYTFHMPAFLIISGFFLDFNNDISKSIHKTFRRIMVPYFVFGSLYLLGLVLIQSLNIHTNNAPPATMLDFFKILFFSTTWRLLVSSLAYNITGIHTGL